MKAWVRFRVRFRMIALLHLVVRLEGLEEAPACPAYAMERYG